ncbi:branched chain amino acid ABC transporter substrate-binding protein [Bacteroidia bacterium]|nr:branched chain amino acid ABC transporter substrate-binding protein [Bacteroidia bacterium]
MTGHLGYYGQWIKNGMDLAKIDLQRQIDSLNIVFDFDYQDNRGETKDAINVMQKQFIAKPDIYMSGITSQTMAMIDQIRNKEITHVLWSWTPLFLEENNHEYRCWVNYGIEGEKLSEYCNQKSPKKLAYIYLDILGAKVQCRDVVVPFLKKHNAELEFYIEEYPISTNDFKNIVLKIRDYNPDIIILSGFKEHLMNLIKDCDNYNIDRAKIICSMDLLDAINDVSNELLEGLHVTAPAFNIIDRQTPKTKEWIRNFTKNNSREPLYTEAYSYDFMTILFNAAKIAKEKSISIEDAFSEVDIQGITGRLHFQKNGEIESNLSVGVFRNGKVLSEQ